jgi:hypothetical protein
MARPARRVNVRPVPHRGGERIKGRRSQTHGGGATNRNEEMAMKLLMIPVTIALLAGAVPASDRISPNDPRSCDRWNIYVDDRISPNNPRTCDRWNIYVDDRISPNNPRTCDRWTIYADQKISPNDPSSSDRWNTYV